MTNIETSIVNRVKELFAEGKIKRFVGYKKGEFYYDVEPAVFESAEELKDFVYNGFCGANLSKYLIAISKLEGVTATILKPCDTLSFNQLLKEHRINRENVYVIGVECNGKLDLYKIKELGADSPIEVEENSGKVIVKTLYGESSFEKADVMLEKCISCKGKNHFVADEKIIINQEEWTPSDRFSKVEELEKMSADERFAFWQSELSKCIRCNACRNVCPACSCTKCVFDNPQSGVSAKANDVSFEEQMFHIIRAFHVSGRCTDCGECSRVCPQRIPLHLLNRKFIKDINGFYGEYQAGEESEGKTPLTEFTTEDIEPSEAVK